MLNLQKILVPVDFSESSASALAHAVDLAKGFESKIDVLYVWQPPPYVVPEMMVTVPGGASMAFDDFMRTRTEKDVEQFLADYQDAHVELRAHVEAGLPQEVILRWVAEHPADLIVMGTHGHRGLMHLLMGSVAEGVIRRAPCPVMTVRKSNPSNERKTV